MPWILDWNLADPGVGDDSGAVGGVASPGDIVGDAVAWPPGPSEGTKLSARTAAIRTTAAPPSAGTNRGIKGLPRTVRQTGRCRVLRVRSNVAASTLWGSRSGAVSSSHLPIESSNRSLLAIT